MAIRICGSLIAILLIAVVTPALEVLGEARVKRVSPVKTIELQTGTDIKLLYQENFFTSDELQAACGLLRDGTQTTPDLLVRTASLNIMVSNSKHGTVLIPCVEILARRRENPKECLVNIVAAVLANIKEVSATGHWVNAGDQDQSIYHHGVEK